MKSTGKYAKEKYEMKDDIQFTTIAVKKKYGITKVPEKKIVGDTPIRPGRGGRQKK